jgi:hypothetical protein
VTSDEKGTPFTVRYDEVNAMLLNAKQANHYRFSTKRGAACSVIRDAKPLPGAAPTLLPTLPECWCPLRAEAFSDF